MKLFSLWFKMRLFFRSFTQQRSDDLTINKVVTKITRHMHDLTANLYRLLKSDYV